MSFKIAIASGKGGTGKTTVSANLYYFIWKNGCNNIQLADCDVEEPNDAIFFQNADRESKKDVYQFIPKIDKVKCTFCCKCVEYCEFNAISVIPSVKFAEVNTDLCHSCGACSVACQFNAIEEKPEQIGTISYYDTSLGNGLIEGRLKIGSAMQTMVIKELKKSVSHENAITIYDAPPGTSCPVVETVADTDYIILVTEPTPFGLHDLKLMTELLNDLQKPFGVIVNKAGLGNREVYEYLKEEQIELLGEIPFNKEYAANYAAGAILDDIPVNIEKQYLKIIKKLERRIVQYEGNNCFKR